MAMNEQELLEGLAALESNLQKGGDALQDAPHDGGFATEGKNIQSRDEAKKSIVDALVAKGHSKEEASRLMKMLSASDMGSEEGDDEDEDSEEEEEGAPAPMPPSMEKGKKTKKSLVNDLIASSTPAGIRKSLVDEEPDAEQALDAAPFLQGLIDTMAKSLGQHSGAIGGIAKAVLQSNAKQGDFNARLAKGIITLSGQLSTLQKSLDKIAAQPVPNVRGTSLTKSHVVEPDMHDGNTAAFDGRQVDQRSPLFGMSRQKIENALVDLVTKGGADAMEVTKFEQNGYNLATLPPNLFKALEATLCPPSKA
jgi:hypothetical protein